MPVLLKIEDAKPATFPDPFAAVVHLLRYHCSAEQIQSLRLDVGRAILNHIEVLEHEHDERTGLCCDRNTGSPASIASGHRESHSGRNGTTG